MRRLTLFVAAGAVVLAAIPTRSAGRQGAPPADSLYALVFTRGPAWDGERTVGQQPGMREHSANLNRLRAEERIVLGGRFGDYGLILLRVRDRQEAMGLLAPDSATARGVFRAELSPWYTIYDGSVSRR
jgi:hypothetical protein